MQQYFYIIPKGHECGTLRVDRWQNQNYPLGILPAQLVHVCSLQDMSFLVSKRRLDQVFTTAVILEHTHHFSIPGVEGCFDGSA